MMYRCHVCGGARLVLISQFAEFKRVTSDCKPWPAGGKLGVCEACGTAQTLVDDAWHEECRQIYESYSIYHQAGGAEQAVFDAAAGLPAARSERLIDRVAETIHLPRAGRLLDVGCGNGGFLRAFGRRFPRWRLSGSEYDESHRREVEKIPGVEAFFAKDLNQLPGGYDVISLIHVLEHIESPRDVVASIAEKLTADGTLLIELPCYVENPFELLIADHATHFDAGTIRWVVEHAGLAAVEISTKWIPKELSVCAFRGAVSEVAPMTSDSRLHDAVRWLADVGRDAAAVAEEFPTLGIFGTAIAATWLFSELGGKAAFFVDEDPHRVGRTHMHLPILHPAEVPRGSHVHVPLPPRMSEAIARRLNAPGGRQYHAVPPFEAVNARAERDLRDES